MNFSWDNEWHRKESLTLLALFEVKNLPIEFSHSIEFFIPFFTSKNPSMHPVTVTPQICDSLWAQKILYSAIHTVCFVTHDKDGQDSLGPVVIWITTHPNTTTAEDTHHASPNILTLLEVNGVNSIMVEWFEGAVEKMSGPALLHITEDSDPTYYVHQFLTAGLGMPITTAEREGDDV